MCCASAPRLSAPRSLESSSAPFWVLPSTEESATSAGLRRSRKWRDHMGNSRLHQLSGLGQSVWIDSLSRGWLKDGELARMMSEDAVVGVTSNPTIFQKAMAEGDWYDEQLAEAAKETDDLREIFLALAIEDIKDACDLMKPAWDASDGVDGFVSIEVDPTLAYDRDRTYDQAMRLHAEV